MSPMTLEASLAEAHGAFVDGRLRNTVFKHRQLLALFDLLQANGDILLQSIAGPANKIATELAFSVQVVTTILNKQPKKLKGLVTAKDGSRCEGKGTVVVVANEAHPLASWIVPLAQGISDGNPVVLLIPKSLDSLLKALERPFRTSLDQDAFHIIPQPNSTIDDIVSNNESKVVALITIDSKGASSLPHAPCPLVVDQSIERNGSVESQVQRIAQTLAHTRRLATDQSTQGRVTSASLTTSFPSYIIAHENISAALVSALQAHLPSDYQPSVQRLDQMEDILQVSYEALNYLPVFEVSSIDVAIDAIQGEDAAACNTVYVYAERRFGDYLSENVAVGRVCINAIPEDILVLGPYASPEDFSHTRRQHLSLPVRSSSSFRIPDYKKFVVKRIKQSPGFRIDFFGGSFLFAASMVILPLLGSIGYGLFRAGWAIWHAYN